MPAVNVADLRLAAQRKLPKVVFDFLDGGAGDEISLKASTSEFAALTLRPRVMVDVKERDLSTTLFGRKLAMPLILSPVGLTSMFCPEGELHAARAAEAAGIGYCLSNNAAWSIEDVKAATTTPFWFQLYIQRDRGLTKSFVDRAKAAGCSALIVTVDLAAHGKRERDARNGFTIPPKITPGNALEMLTKPAWLYHRLFGRPLSFANYKTGAEGGFLEIAKFINTQFDPSVTWKDIAWLKSIFPGPVLVKGILTGEDARRAVEHGADGISVSNHGGRQLDAVPSPVGQLPEVVEAVAGRIPVLMDGGVRRGADIIRARALGADAVMIGRAFVYGLAALGPTGAGTVIEMLRAEMDNAMALLGVPRVSEIDRSLLQQEWQRN
jgi:L-lactate dehydrogenase (cytochrome)